MDTSAMANYWAWLAVAGLGALHGLNPATGWGLAAVWGVHSRDRAQALRALMPIGIGHAAALAMVAAAVAFGGSIDRVALQALTGGLLVVALYHLSGRAPNGMRLGHAGLALSSFMMSSAHGAGLMLVPALLPLCVGDPSARETTASSALGPALAAVGVHTAAMLAVAGTIATGACRGWEAAASLLRDPELQSACSARLKARPGRMVAAVFAVPASGVAAAARAALRRVRHIGSRHQDAASVYTQAS